MMLDIRDLLEGLEENEIRLRPKDAASLERIQETVMKNLSPKTAPRPSKALRFLLAAALIATFMSITALAIAHFSLQDMQMEIPMPAASVTVADDTQASTPIPVKTEQKLIVTQELPEMAESTESNAPYTSPIPLTGSVTLLSMAGLQGSPEYEATLEWERLVMDWYAQGLNDPYEADWINHSLYVRCNAFTQEARDALDEILEKYNLTLHEAEDSFDTAADLYILTGRRGFLPNSGGMDVVPTYGGMYYADGSFTLTATAKLSGGAGVGYEIRSWAKGTFNRGFITVTDYTDQWDYTTRDGMDVTLALGEDQSLVIADLENTFVTVKIYSGTVNQDFDAYSYGIAPIDREALEDLADMFDFSVINKLCKTD